MTKNSNEDQSDFSFDSQLGKEASEQPPADQPPKEASLFGEEKPSPNDARSMLKRIDEMHEDLKRQIKFIEDNIKHLPEELQIYYKNPGLVIKEHNQQIEAFEKSMEEKLVKLIGESVVTGLETRKQKQEHKRGSKAQRLRGRNKWISMD